jgi:hypothetical protein
MIIPELDDTIIRAIAVQAAGQCSPPDAMTLISWADIIEEYIDPIQCVDRSLSSVKQP